MAERPGRVRTRSPRGRRDGGQTEGRAAAPLADSRQAPGETGSIQALQQTAGNQAVGQLLEASSNRGRDLPVVEQALRSPSTMLDETTRSSMEARLGHDLGDVRVHTGADAERSADALNAEAFTLGEHVVLGPDAARAGGAGAKGVLAHELTHVVQQRGARASGQQTTTLEATAEHSSQRAHGGAPAAVAPVGAVGVQRRTKTREKEGARPEPEPGAEKETEPEPKDAGEKGGTKEEEKKKPKTGVLSSIWSGIKGAASTVWSGMKTAGKAIWGGMKAAGGAIWEGMKTVGGWIAAGAEKVWAAAKWLGRQLWDKVTGIFGRITRWVTKLPARVGRLFAGLWEGLTSLKPWSLAWWKSLASVDTWLGFLKWLGSRVVDLLEILGIGEVYETVMDLIKFNTRSLTSQEIADASKVFGTTINLSLVRVDEHAVIGPAFTHREYTSFHTINGWGDISPDTLIHELTHVWQYETAGAIYMPQALHAQITRGQGAYVYGGAAGLQAKKAAGQGIAAFNREEQAQIVQDFYRLKHGMNTQGGPATAADLPLYADFVKDVSTLSIAQLLA